MILETQEPVRAYALNGMAITYANEIEDTMFWCYVAASGKSWEDAADSFYERVKFSCKQDKTDKAVTERVAGTEHAAAWKDLNKRIQGLLGQGNSLRNLVGHNKVSTNIYIPHDQTPDDENVVIHVLQEVSQKRAMVERQKRQKVKVGTAQLAVYCEDLVSLYLDLEGFAETALQCGHSHPLRCGHDAGD